MLVRVSYIYTSDERVILTGQTEYPVTVEGDTDPRLVQFADGYGELHIKEQGTTLDRMENIHLYTSLLKAESHSYVKCRGGRRVTTKTLNESSALFVFRYRQV